MNCCTLNAVKELLQSLSYNKRRVLKIARKLNLEPFEYIRVLQVLCTTDRLDFRADAPSEQIAESILFESNFLSTEMLVAALGLFSPSELHNKIYEQPDVQADIAARVKEIKDIVDAV